MPAFEVTTPDGRKYRVDAPDGATQEEAIAYIRDQQSTAQPALDPVRRTLPQELSRQAGLTLRAGAEGLAGLPGIFVDPFQKLAGGTTMTQATSDLLTKLGVPKPESGTEEVAGAISRGMAGGGGGATLARGIPMLAGAGPSAINNILAQQPLAQTLQAGIGGGASELTRQMGGGETAQLLAGAVAPLAATTGVNAASIVARGARELARPITKGGANQVAADVLGSITSDKKAALANLDNYLAMKAGNATGLGVPGSKPTASAVAADYGLIGGEQLAARGPSNPEFAKRYAENNQARLDELAKLKATPEQVAEYIGRRDEITSPMREAAFANATGPVDYQPVAQKILDLAKTPEGGRENSRKALEWLSSRLNLYANDGRTAPQYADALRMDIGDLVAGKISNEQGSIRLAAGLANDVKKTLAGEIDKAAPGFARYLETYSRLSKPIDRLEILSERLGGADLTRVTNATPLASPSGASFGVSQAKMRNQIGNIERQIPVGRNGLPLAPYQRDVLGRVMGDLNSEALASRGGKMPGSDTYQNMATANLLSSIFGKTLAEAGIPKAVSGPFNFAYKPLEQRIRNIVDEAYLDPKKMSELLKISRGKRNSPTLQDLLTTSQQNIYGGLLGGAVN